MIGRDSSWKLLTRLVASVIPVRVQNKKSWKEDLVVKESCVRKKS